MRDITPQQIKAEAAEALATTQGIETDDLYPYTIVGTSVGLGPNQYFWKNLQTSQEGPRTTYSEAVKQAYEKKRT